MTWRQRLKSGAFWHEVSMFIKESKMTMQGNFREAPMVLKHQFIALGAPWPGFRSTQLVKVEQLWDYIHPSQCGLHVWYWDYDYGTEETVPAHDPDASHVMD